MPHRNVVEVKVIGFTPNGLKMLCECGAGFEWKNEFGQHPERPTPGLNYCPTCGLKAHVSATIEVLEAVGIHTRNGDRKRGGDPVGSVRAIMRDDSMGSIHTMAETLAEAAGLTGPIEDEASATTPGAPGSACLAEEVGAQFLEGMHDRTAKRIEAHQQHPTSPPSWDENNPILRSVDRGMTGT